MSQVLRHTGKFCGSKRLQFIKQELVSGWQALWTHS